jgi:16S rRNA (cytidine1402-2'-O)-methyltransferase
MPDAPLAPGLYLVATPIGNLGDITFRAIEVLKGVDRIACEDTRQTQKLLNHYGIATPTVSYHEHNERDRAAKLIEDLKAGARIAVVSDAGTPGISDPGSVLVREAIGAGIAVIPIPGASAAISALISSGMPAGEFHFIGFLPEKAGARRTRLEALAEQHRGSAQTIILYEAPHRIMDTLADLEAVFGPSLRVVAGRELTKLHEEFLRGSVSEVRSRLTSRDRIRGEFVLLMETPAASEKVATPHLHSEMRETISNQIKRLQAELSLDEKEALKRLARESGISKSELYRELQRERAKRR